MILTYNSNFRKIFAFVLILIFIVPETKVFRKPGKKLFTTFSILEKYKYFKNHDLSQLLKHSTRDITFLNTMGTVSDMSQILFYSLKYYINTIF